MRQILPSVNTSAIFMATRTINKEKGGRYEITRKGESSRYMGNWLVSTHYNYLNDYLWYAIINGEATQSPMNNTFPSSSWQKLFAKQYSSKEAYVCKPEVNR